MIVKLLSQPTETRSSRATLFRGPQRATWVPLLLFLLNLIGVIQTFCGEQQQVVDSPWRIILASFLVTLVPGAVLGQLLGIKTTHPLETVAKSFLLTLLVNTPIALLVFVLHGSIDTWAAILLGWNLMGSLLVLVFRKFRHKHALLLALPARLIARRHLANLLLITTLGALAVSMYRWADSLTAVQWKVGVHLTYIREYGSGLPLDFSATSLRPELLTAAQRT